MNDRIEKVTTLAKSATARDTAVLFSGNVLAAFLGFLFTLIIARALSVEEFGVFSAASNLFIILSYQKTTPIKRWPLLSTLR